MDIAALGVSLVAVVVSLLAVRYAREQTRYVREQAQEARRANQLVEDQVASNRAAEAAAKEANRYRWVAVRDGDSVSVYNDGTDVAHDVRLHSASMFFNSPFRVPCPDHQDNNVGCPGADVLAPGVPINASVITAARVGDGKREIKVSWREGAQPASVGVTMPPASQTPVGRPPRRRSGPGW